MLIRTNTAPTLIPAKNDVNICSKPYILLTPPQSFSIKCVSHVLGKASTPLNMHPSPSQFFMFVKLKTQSVQRCKQQYSLNDSAASIALNSLFVIKSPQFPTFTSPIRRRNIGFSASIISLQSFLCPMDITPPMLAVLMNHRENLRQRVLEQPISLTDNQ